MCSLQLSAVMLLYINQQLNVILYTYSFKRNSNQSLELNNLSARENDFQNIKSNMQTQGLWATKEQTLFHRDKGLLYNYLWGQRSRGSHRQSKNNYGSNCIDHLRMDSSETWIWPQKGDVCKFYWQSMAMPSYSWKIQYLGEISDRSYKLQVKMKIHENSVYFANCCILLCYSLLNLIIYLDKSSIKKSRPVGSLSMKVKTFCLVNCSSPAPRPFVTS